MAVRREGQRGEDSGAACPAACRPRMHCTSDTLRANVWQGSAACSFTSQRQAPAAGSLAPSEETTPVTYQARRKAATGRAFPATREVGR